MADENAIEMRAILARREALRERWALDPEEEAGMLGGTALDGPVEAAVSWRASRM